jgi:hypothetical protein
MRTHKIVYVGLGIALTLGVSAGAGLAQAATPTTHSVTPACSAATQQVTFTQARIDDDASTRSQIANQVTAQKSARQHAINTGAVDSVGQYNVQLGSSTAIYNTMDSALATAQAQLVQDRTAKNAAC